MGRSRVLHLSMFVAIAGALHLQFQNCQGLPELATNTLNALTEYPPKAPPNLDTGASEERGGPLKTSSLKIQWSLGPALPFGFQDSAFAKIQNELISVYGFSDAHGGASSGDFFAGGFRLDLSLPTAEWSGVDQPSTWTLARRQGAASVAVGNALYVFGGFNREGSLRDAFKVVKTQSGWQWEVLPVQLPDALAGANAVSIGNKIYILGGSYFAGAAGYLNYRNSVSGTPVGKRLLVFDTNSPESGFRELAQLPGSPRFIQAMAVVAGNLYVFGGATGNDNKQGVTCTVLDNWVYKPAQNTWEKLRDTPVASGNFSSGAIVHLDRYVLLIGGYDYGYYSNKWETACNGPTDLPKPSSIWPKNGFYSQILVYDTLTREFSETNPLPVTNNLPGVFIENGIIHMIGGEATKSPLGGRDFGHRPSLYLKGRIVSVEDAESELPGVVAYEPGFDAILRSRSLKLKGICTGPERIRGTIADINFSTECEKGRFDKSIELESLEDAATHKLSLSQFLKSGKEVSHEQDLTLDLTGKLSIVEVTLPSAGTEISGTRLRVSGKCRRDLAARGPVAVIIGSYTSFTSCVAGTFSTEIDISKINLGSVAIGAGQRDADGVLIKSTEIPVVKTSLTLLKDCTIRGVTLRHGKALEIFKSARAVKCEKLNTVCRDGELSLGVGFAACTAITPIKTEFKSPLVNSGSVLSISNPVRYSGACEPLKGRVQVVLGSLMQTVDCVGEENAGVFSGMFSGVAFGNMALAAKSESVPAYEHQLALLVIPPERTILNSPVSGATVTPPVMFSGTCDPSRGKVFVALGSQSLEVACNAARTFSGAFASAATGNTQIGVRALADSTAYESTANVLIMAAP